VFAKPDVLCQGEIFIWILKAQNNMQKSTQALFKRGLSAFLHKILS